MIDVYFIPVMAAALVGGAGTGLLGVQIVGMRIPLLGVVISHAAMVATVAALATFVGLFHRELRAILFSRELVRAGGVHETVVWTAFLVLAALTLAVNLSAVGGLMIFSLLSNAAVAAARLA